MEKALLMLNPKSGKQEGKNKFYTIVSELSKKYRLEVHITKSSDDIIATAEKCDYDTVIVCGGDGTLSLTVNGLVRGGHAETKVGYIPCGTANDFATTHKLAKNVKDAVIGVCKGSPKKVDRATFNGKQLIYIASFGAFTKASYETPQDVKNMFGNLAYFFSGIGEFVNLPEIPARIEWDGGVLEEKSIIFCAACNTRVIGGGFVKFPPELSPLDDGELELLIVRKPKNLIDLDKAIKEIVSGRFDNEFVTLLHSKRYKIVTEKGILWTVDGEGVNAPELVEIECIEKGLTLIS